MRVFDANKDIIDMQVCKVCPKLEWLCTTSSFGSYILRRQIDETCHPQDDGYLQSTEHMQMRKDPGRMRHLKTSAAASPFCLSLSRYKFVTGFFERLAILCFIRGRHCLAETFIVTFGHGMKIFLCIWALHHLCSGAKEENSRPLPCCVDSSLPVGASSRP